MDSSRPPDESRLYPDFKQSSTAPLRRAMPVEYERLYAHDHTAPLHPWIMFSNLAIMPSLAITPSSTEPMICPFASLQVRPGAQATLLAQTPKAFVTPWPLLQGVPAVGVLDVLELVMVTMEEVRLAVVLLLELKRLVDTGATELDTANDTELDTGNDVCSEVLTDNELLLVVDKLGKMLEDDNRLNVALDVVTVVVKAMYTRVDPPEVVVDATAWMFPGHVMTPAVSVEQDVIVVVEYCVVVNRLKLLVLLMLAAPVAELGPLA